MKLYEIPRDSKIYELEPNGDKNGVVVFHRLDGMYSYCTILGKEGDGVLHLNASTSLEKYKDGYRLESNTEKEKL